MGLTSIRPRTIRARENLVVHDQKPDVAGKERLKRIKGRMPRPKARYVLLVKNQISGSRLKVELVDLPFSDGRRFRLRVNGHWAQKLPVASKSTVLHQVRGWLVRH
jgi:hypothetical protein